MYNKLTEEQRERVGDMLEEIYNIFTNEDNDFTEDSISEWLDSKLCMEIEDALYDLDRRC